MFRVGALIGLVISIMTEKMPDLIEITSSKEERQEFKRKRPCKQIK